MSLKVFSRLAIIQEMKVVELELANQQPSLMLPVINIHVFTNTSPYLFHEENIHLAVMTTITMTIM